MLSPYINTYLITDVSIHPSKINNEIRSNIKDTLIEQVGNKCFLDYGYVLQVHEFVYDNEARIVREDPLMHANYRVRFLCTLCYPLNGSIIVGHVSGISELVIKISNGPLSIVVKSTNVGDKFIFNKKLQLWTIEIENDKETTDGRTKKYAVLKMGAYVKVKILSKRIMNKAQKILCMGYLSDIATTEEGEKSIKDIYASKDTIKSDTIVDNIDEYISMNDVVESEEE